MIVKKQKYIIQQMNNKLRPKRLHIVLYLMYRDQQNKILMLGDNNEGETLGRWTDLLEENVVSKQATFSLHVILCHC